MAYVEVDIDTDGLANDLAYQHAATLANSMDMSEVAKKIMDNRSMVDQIVDRISLDDLADCVSDRVCFEALADRILERNCPELTASLDKLRDSIRRFHMTVNAMFEYWSDGMPKPKQEDGE